MKRILAAAVCISLGVVLLTYGLFLWLSSESGSRERRVRIAVAGPMGTENGREMVRGAMLFVEQMERQDRFEEIEIELVTYDDRNRQTAVKVANEIANENKVMVVLGHYTSDSSLAAGSIYGKKGIPAITASATAENVTFENDWFFRTVSANTRVAEFAAAYMKKELDASSASLIYSSDPFSASIAGHFETAARERGIPIPRKIVFDAGGPAMLREIKNISGRLRASESPGMIFFATHAPEAVEFLATLRYPGTDYPVMGPDTLAEPGFVSHLQRQEKEKTRPGYYSDGIYAVSHFFGDLTGREGLAFQESFIRKYGKTPSWVAASYYDAMHAAVAAVQRAEVTGEDIIQDRKRVREALARFDHPDTAVKGISGDIFFDRHGNSAKPLYMGIWHEQTLLPAFRQYRQMPSGAGTKADRDQADLYKKEQDQKEVLRLEGAALQEVRVIYAGIDVNDIPRLDLKTGRFRADFYLWFRSTGDFDDRRIIFTNAVDPISLDRPFATYRAEGGVVIRTYRVIADFKADFAVPLLPSDPHTLPIRLRHADLSESELVYVPDAPGHPIAHTGLMPRQQNRKTAQWLEEKLTGIIPQWRAAGIFFLQEITNPGEEGPAFSQFSAEIEIVRSDRIALLIKMLLPGILFLILLYSAYLLPERALGSRMLILIGITGAGLLFHYLQIRLLSPHRWIDLVFGWGYLLSAIAAMLSVLTYATHKRGMHRMKRFFNGTGKCVHIASVAALWLLLIWRYAGDRIPLNAFFRGILTMALAFLLIHPPLLHAREASPNSAASAAPELYKLNNAALIEGAASSFAEASDGFYRQLRGVYTYETLLLQAREKRAVIRIPVKQAGEAVGTEGGDILEAAKATAAAARFRVEALDDRLREMTAEKDLLDALIKQSEAAISGAVNFLDILEDLDLFLLEIEWRLADGTLLPDNLPGFADPQAMEEQKQTVRETRTLLTVKIEDAGAAMTELLADIDDTRKQLIEASARQASEEERYGREQRRRTLEEEYAEYSRAKLGARLSEFQEERIWLTGAFNLTHGRFLMKEREADGIEQEVEAALKPAPLSGQGAVPSGEMEEITRQMESAAASHSDRIGLLVRLRSVLESLIEVGGNLQGDATVLAGHLFKMQVIADILHRAGKDDQIPEMNRPGMLAEAGRSLSEKTAHAAAILRTSQDRIEKIEKEIQKSADAEKEVRHQLASLKIREEALIRARRWEADLKDLTGQEILDRFRETAEQLARNQETVESTAAGFNKANRLVEEIRLEFESLKDPMLRAAESESIGEKKRIRKTLYEDSGFEVEPEVSAGGTDGSENPQETGSGEKPDSGKEKDPPGAVADSSAEPSSLVSAIDARQNLLTGRYRIIEEQRKMRGELLKALGALEKQIEAYLVPLQKSRELAARRYADAVELKKRLGRGELNADQVPDEITGALKPDTADAIEEIIAGKVNDQARIRREMETLGTRNESLENIGTSLSLILENAGKRLDMLHNLESLKQSFESGPETLSPTEAKSMEQAAVRRMENEESLSEYLVGFVPSERAKEMTDLLRAYYAELMELERKKKILGSRAQVVDRLIRLSEQEKKLVSEILPLFSEQIKGLKMEEEERWLIIKAQLMPEKAAELLNAFEMKTGRRIPPPPQIIEKDKKDVVDQSIEILFAGQVEIAAAGKWIELFEKRLSLSGIDAEIGGFQDRLGVIQSGTSGIDRHRWELVGYPPAEVGRQISDQKELTPAERSRLLKGKIGAMREELYRVRREAALGVVGRLVTILLIAALISLGVNLLINRIVKRSGKMQQKTVSAVSLLPLLKTIFLFFVWITAAISALSTLGFNVGAILAGLGIGGLAVAMASKEMLSDIIGGVSILLSKSFQIGDSILFKGQKATVEEIGLRYTRMRYDATNFRITVPNSLLSQTETVNLSSSSEFYVNIDLPLSIRNSMEKVRGAAELVAGVIGENPETRLKNIKFTGFSNYSFLISFRYIISDFSRRHAVRTEIHSELVGQLREKEIELASVPHMDMKT